MAIEWLNSIRNVDLGGSGSMAVDSAYQTAGSMGVVIGKAAVFILAGICMFFLFRKYFLYKIEVFVFKKYANGIKLIKKKGRIYKDKDGKYYFKIADTSPFSLKDKTIEIVDFDYFINKTKGDSVFLYQVSPEDYKPIKLIEVLKDNQPAMDFSILDLNASNHALLMHKEIINKERNKNKALIYMPIIMVVLGMAFIVLILWITLGRIEQMNQAMTSGYELMANAIRDFGKQII